MRNGDDQLVADYLSRLAASAAILPAERRDELIEEISAHITEARAGAAGAAGSGVRAILDRLGDPEDIVRAAAEQAATEQPAAGPAGMPAGEPGLLGGATSVGGAGGSPGWVQTASPAAPPSERRLGALENCAIALLLVGGFLVGIGWIVGVVLLWSSPRWRISDKVLGTLEWPGGLALLLAVLGLAALTPASVSACSAAQTSCGPGVDWAAIVLVLAVVIAIIGGPVFVAIRLARRARAMPVEPTGQHGTLPSSY